MSYIDNTLTNTHCHGEVGILSVVLGTTATKVVTIPFPSLCFQEYHLMGSSYSQTLLTKYLQGSV